MLDGLRSLLLYWLSRPVVGKNYYISVTGNTILKMVYHREGVTEIGENINPLEPLKQRDTICNHFRFYKENLGQYSRSKSKTIF